MSEKVRKPRLIISSDEKKTIVQHREELTMAKRPVFIAKETAPFYQMTEIKFEQRYRNRRILPHCIKNF